MPLNLKLDIGQVLRKKKQSNASEHRQNLSLIKKNIQSFVLCIILMSAAILTFVYQIYIPLYDSNEKKGKELAELNRKAQSISDLDKQINILEKKVNESKVKYLEQLSHFGSSDNLENLYQSISTIANRYNITVLNIQESSTKNDKQANKPAANPAKPAAGTATANNAKPNNNKVAVKEIKVEATLKGRYSDYIKFKEDLAVAEVLLNINQESITVDAKSNEGVIESKINLSTYAINKQPFNDALDNKDSNISKDNNNVNNVNNENKETKEPKDNTNPTEIKNINIKNNSLDKKGATNVKDIG